jgi:hypothetical protein
LGEDEIRLYILENRGDAREGTVTIAGYTVTIKQRASRDGNGDDDDDDDDGDDDDDDGDPDGS